MEKYSPKKNWCRCCLLLVKGSRHVVKMATVFGWKQNGNHFWNMKKHINKINQIGRIEKKNCDDFWIPRWRFIKHRTQSTAMSTCFVILHFVLVSVRHKWIAWQMRSRYDIRTIDILFFPQFSRFFRFNWHFIEKRLFFPIQLQKQIINKLIFWRKWFSLNFVV